MPRGLLWLQGPENAAAWVGTQGSPMHKLCALGQVTALSVLFVRSSSIQTGSESLRPALHEMVAVKEMMMDGEKVLLTV